MQTLKLPSKKYLRECFDYEQESGTLRWRERPLKHFSQPGKPTWLAKRNRSAWNTKYAGHEFGKISTDGGRVGTIDYVYYKAHRLIFKWMTGVDPIQIDHRDRDRLNNRWDNLRNATQSQNQANVGAMRHNRIGLKGVKHAPSGANYIARININGRQRHLGMFSTPEAAHAAYLTAARARWGEFAAGE